MYTTSLRHFQEKNANSGRKIQNHIKRCQSTRMTRWLTLEWVTPKAPDDVQHQITVILCAVYKLNCCFKVKNPETKGGGGTADITEVLIRWRTYQSSWFVTTDVLLLPSSYQSITEQWVSPSQLQFQSNAHFIISTEPNQNLMYTSCNNTEHASK